MLWSAPHNAQQPLGMCHDNFMYCGLICATCERQILLIIPLFTVVLIFCALVIRSSVDKLRLQH